MPNLAEVLISVSVLLVGVGALVVLLKLAIVLDRMERRLRKEEDEEAD
ncbi:MAG: hypothetical protein ACE5JP_12150 [Candidatus Bipolaricaulia bacterium]